MAALMADGGRLLCIYVLKDMASTREGYWNEYLQTNHWQSIKERTYKIHGRRCTLGVNCEGPLDVHHISYENLGEEKPEDTEILCRKHHHMKHEAEKAFVRAQMERQFNQP